MLSVLAAKDQPAQAGPLGLFVILLLAVALFFLIRSMNRHLRRIPPTFDQPAADQPAADQPAADVPPTDQPAADQPAAEAVAESPPPDDKKP